MSDKLKGKYRNESIRLKNWYYSSGAAYFIKICTQNRKHFLGEFVVLPNHIQDRLKEE